MFETISEILLSTILTASIAGAGLIIAILTLVAQLRNRIFENRLTMLSDKMKEFDKAKESITPEKSYKGAEQLKAIGSEIASMEGLPTYLTNWVKLVLSGFFLTSFFSLFWLTNAVENQVAEFVLIILFAFSTFGFFVVVASATKDVQELMKEEFEQLKEKQKEVKETMNEDLGKMKKDIEELKEREDRRVS